MDAIRDRLWQKAGSQKIPLTGAFELLPVCNLSCKMCYVRKSMDEVRAGGGLLSGETWLDYAEQAGRCGLLYPLLTGGEPFLHPEFQKILTGMQAMGMQVSINTNGTMLDRPLVAWLGKHRPTRVNITLYGASEDDYARLCGNAAAFGKVREAVSLCREYEIPIKFNVSVTPENVDSLDSLRQYAQEVNVALDVAAYMFPPVRRDRSMVGQNARLLPEDAARIQFRLTQQQAAPEFLHRQAERYRHFADPSSLAPRGTRGLPITCRAGASAFWIDWQGSLSGCGIYGPIQISLKEQPFAEAWRQLVAATAETRFFPACADCPNLAICTPCIAKVYGECGDVSGRPEYLCRMYAETARLYRQLDETLSEGGERDAH